MRIERWMEISGFNNYLISDYGRVRSKSRIVYRANRLHGIKIPHRAPGRILKPRKTKVGYLRVSLSNRLEKSKDFAIHRLVATAFVEGRFDGASVNHKDMDKSNNHHMNLEWVTHAQNMGHLAKSGKLKGIFSGSKNPNYRNKSKPRICLQR